MNERSRFVLRIVAGVYLAYLGVKMIQGLIVDKPENMMFMFAMAVIFVIVGVLFILSSVKNMRSSRNAETPQEETNADYIEDSPVLENKAAETAEDKEEADEVPEAGEEESGGEADLEVSGEETSDGDADLEAADEEDRYKE
ncbi:hypothetical protein [Faecalicatena contorta]|uniref:Uncharacterized protein n=1 Tax=Faecalicatena contorta TaxID=39482 RepID=A0A315ZZ67_9FIRM|nr:hypothetical protein [Faecalicatena contorta]PWJ50805.1 hypothetical protein A8805_103101 [Faecalicatena contorta]SUQ13373.1 hypothetical protein SAMN05216529_103101 [Faecalicatena contorta]